MTEREWAAFAAELEATFRGDLAEDRESAVKTHLAGVPFEAARGAIRRLVLDGQSWLPTPAEVLGALRRSAGERPVRAWLAGYATAEDYERAVTAKYLGLIETTNAQMPQLGSAE